MYFDVTRIGEDQGEPANTFMDGQVFGCAVMTVLTVVGLAIALFAGAPIWATAVLGIAALVSIGATWIWFRALRRRDHGASEKEQTK